MRFAEWLLEGVRLVGGVSKSARLCGVTRQTVYRWMKQTERPAWATQVGVTVVLRAAIEAMREKQRRIERQDLAGGRFLRLQEERRLAQLKRNAGGKSGQGNVQSPTP